MLMETWPSVKATGTDMGCYSTWKVVWEQGGRGNFSSQNLIQ